MIAEQMLEGTSLYPAIDPEMLIVTGRIVADNLNIGPDFTDAYWLGWVNFDNLPVDYHLSNFTINGDTVTLTDVTEQKNYDIGYTVGNANNPAYKAGVIRYDEDNTHWVAWDHQEPDIEAHSLAMRLCNQVDINRQGLTRIVPIFAINPMDSNSVSKSYTMAFCVVDAPTFLKDDTWTANATIVDLRGSSGISGTVTFSASDIDGQVHTRVLGGVNCEYFCCGFQIENSNWTMYNPQTDEYEFTTIQSTLRPFFALEANGFDGKYVVNAASAPFNDGFSLYYGAGYVYNQRYGFLWQYNQNYHLYQTKPFDTTDGLMAGNFVGSFSAAAVRERFPSSNTYGFYGVDGANFILQSTGIYEFVMIRRLYSIDEIRKTMSLYPRIINPDFPDYVNYANLDTPSINDPIYAEVTADNEFITDTVSGGLDCLIKLKTWQRIGVKIAPEFSPYDTADKPEYTPSGSKEPDEGNWGDPVNISRTDMGDTAFSNFEVVRRDGLLEFVSELWEAPAGFWESLSVLGKVTANLGDYLISCRAYPVSLKLSEGTHHDIYLGAGGKITLAADIHSATTTNEIQMGSITIPRQYGSFLDYNPYTSATISLPFAGTFEINPKFLYDSPIELRLVVDITDGSGIWILMNQTRSFPILIKQCRIAADIPVSGLNATQMASNILNATLATGQHALNSINKIGSAISSGGVKGIVTTGAQAGFQALTDATNMAMSNKEIPFYTGGSGGAAAAEGNFEPYITLRRPLCTNPSNFAHTVGNLVNQTATISSLNGFTVCRNVDASGIGQATDKEKAQIKQILESGFYA